MRVGDPPIQPELAALLERFHFDRVPFEQLRARLASASRSAGGCDTPSPIATFEPGGIRTEHNFNVDGDPCPVWHNQGSSRRDDGG